jgi:UV DNA damage repair endonuclease
MKKWLTLHVVRLYAVAATLVPIAATVRDTLPWELSAGLATAVVVAGEFVQRVENVKTLRASLAPLQD